MAKPKLEIFYISVNNVGIECTDKESVLEWIRFSLDKGLVPEIKKLPEAA